MPGKTARALCPVCQEAMPPDETECENCGAFVIDEAVVRLSRAFGIPREKALALFEQGFRHPKQLKDRNVDDVLERQESGLLFLCTNCGGFVATGDPRCPRCSAEFAPEEPAPAEEKDILDLVLCPVCGADNEPIWKECEICGEPLGGTEEPPGETPEAPMAVGETPTPAPEPARPAEPEPVSEARSVERLDDILQDLEASVPGPPTPAVRPRARVPKVARPAKPTAPRTEAPAPRPAPRPARALAPRPVPKAIPRPAPKPASRPASTVNAPPPQRIPPARPSRPPARPRSPSTHRLAVAPPPEFTGALTAAAAVTLALSNGLGQTAILWAAVLVLFILALFVLVAVLSRREVQIGGRNALLLTVGAFLGMLAPFLPTVVAPVAALATAVPLALATRVLLRTPARDLITAASSGPLMVLGAVAAMGWAYASTTSWIVGLVAAAPWPAAVAALGVRMHHATVAVGRELSQAERDLARRDYAQSVKDFDRAIAAGTTGTPDAEVPWYGKGATLILLGRYDEALHAIDTALDMNPRNEVAWLNKGNALTKMGRLVDALRCFNAALKVNPRYEVAWNNKGNTLARMGHFEEALACYERALALDPEYRGAWVNKGYVLTKLGRYDEATSCADRALRLNGRVRTKAA